MRWKESDRSFRLRFDNRISVEILKDGDTFGGIGQVKLGRRKLRSDELPVLPLITTPNGFEVVRLEFEDIERAEECVVLQLRPFVVSLGRMEWLCWDGQDRWHVGSWAEESQRDRGGMLQVTIRAEQHTIGGMEFVGFSYAYKFYSRKYHVYRIQDRSTWELGGWATGNDFWMASPFSPPRKTIRNKEDSYSTSWRTRDEEPVQIQQFLPFFTALQGFTFQFDKQTLLVTAFEDVFHCDSLFQKESGRNYMVHWHQLCDDLSGCLEFPAHLVLCCEEEVSEEAERVDQYCAVRQELEARHRSSTGVLHDGAVASSWMERAGGAEKRMEHGLDALARARFKRVYIPDLMLACAPAGDTVRARREAARAVERFMERAHARGIEVALCLDDCCRRWLLADSLEEGEGYPEGHMLLEAALREDACRAFLLRHMRRIRVEFGVEALFASNMLEGFADQFDWEGPPGQNRIARSPATIRSLAMERLRLVAELQQIGYRCLSWGAGELATPGLEPPYDVKSDSEFMFRDRVLRFPHEAVSAGERDPLEVYFRGCAHRLSYMPVCTAGRAAGGKMEDWWDSEFGAVNKAFQAVREHMETSSLLPAGRGILWRGAEPGVEVLWSFKSFELTVGPEAEIFDIMESEQVHPPQDKETVRIKPCGVYLLQDACVL